LDWLPVAPPLTALIYAAWQTYNHVHWRRAIVPVTVEGESPRISIVVPFRNEAHNLDRLLRSLAAQHYPADKYELILVDDHSSDGGAAGAEPLPKNSKLFRLADYTLPRGTVAFKKAALTLGIAHAAGEVIVTTDADCEWSPDVLYHLGQRFAAGADVVLGPVLVAPVGDFCTAFQALDLAAYQLFTAATITAGTPALANGAQFAFRRSAFERVGGYTGVDHLPSGDDVLLLHKFAAAGNFRIDCTTAAAGVVTTRPVAGWRAFWRQRLRWAGKAGNYTSTALSVAQALAFVTSVAILSGLLLSFVNVAFLPAALAAWLIKGGVDWVLLRSVCRHYGYGELMRWYLPAQLIYPFYLVAIGTAALLGVKSEWKGRP